MVSSYLSNVVPKVYGKNALVLFFQRQGQEVAEALIEKLEREWNYDRAGGKPLTLFNMLHRAIHNNEADTSFKKKEEDKPAATSAGEGMIDYLVHKFQKLEHGFKSDEGNGEKGQKPKAIPINGKMTIDLGGKKQSVETCYPKYDALMQKMISHVNNFLNEDVDSGFDTRTINVQIMKVRLRLSAIYTQPLKLIYPNSTLASLYCPTASDGDFGVEEALGSRGRQQGAEGQGGARKGVREQAE